MAMLNNLMEEKQLDLDAPLLSVRRFTSEPETQSNPNPHPKRSALPFYKSDLKPGPIRNPGVVPFVWEQSPGHPKDRPRLDGPLFAPKPPPGRISNEKESANPTTTTIEASPEVEDEKENESIQSKFEEEEEEKEDEFTDALETLSRTESFFMNCSVSGISETPGKREASGSFSTDPQLRDFMMGRFLPAAKAMATGSLHPSSRRAPPPPPPVQILERVENVEERRIRYPGNYQHGEGEGTSCEYEEDEEEEEYYEDRNLSNACGLLPKFCMKSSFCLMNPVPVMKAPNRRLQGSSVRRVHSPQIKAVQHGSLGHAEEEYSWEAVYKHKLMHGNPSTPPQGEDVSKLTSESNHLTYWSDSPTANGSSHHHSNSGGVSPYRNEPSQSPFLEGKGFLGIPRRDKNGSKTNGSDSFEKGSEKYWLVTPQHSSQCGSGSMSPAVERTVHVDAVHMPESPNSKSSSLDTSSDNEVVIKSVDEDSEVGVQSQRMDESLVLETNDGGNGMGVLPESSAIEGMNENNDFKPSNVDDGPLRLEQNRQVKNDADIMPSLVPPPLPNSPSESWLSRTLPFVSSKNPSSQSFLGIQFQPRKQAINSSLIVPMEPTRKPSKVQRGQTRFADMLSKPLSPQSEI